MGQSPRKLTGYTTERVTFLIILEVLLTTWNSDYFVSFDNTTTVCFIGGGNRSTRKKPPTCWKSLKNFAT
jgi:hypothetical protein